MQYLLGSIRRLSDAAHGSNASKKRRISYHDIGFGPDGFGAVGVDDGVAAFDGIEGVEDGVAGAAEAVAAHPLDFADPDGDAGEFGGVGVYLDAFDVGRADGGEGATAVP